jgi:hypothetical protein
MKKIRLDLDHLRVDSFDVQKRRGTERGTVKGHNTYPEPSAWFNTCSGCSWEGIDCCTDPYCSEVNC